MGGTRRNRSQTLVLLLPVGKVQGHEGSPPIPFPLPPEHNLIDLALLDNEFRSLDLAMAQRDRDRATRHMRALLQRYPKSRNLRLIAASEPLLVDPSAPLVGLAELGLNPGASTADRVAVLGARATAHLQAMDLPSAVRELEAAIQPDLAPADYIKERATLAGIYETENELEKAGALYQQLCRCCPDSIDVVAGYERLLLRQGKLAEAEKLAERDIELSRIYRVRPDEP
jgi:tetratricopeptide (TPR) repeat protein